MRISDWSSDVCSSDLNAGGPAKLRHSFPARLAGAHPRPAGVAAALHGTRSRGHARGAGDRSRGEGARDRAHGGFDTGWADGPAPAPTGVLGNTRARSIVQWPVFVRLDRRYRVALRRSGSSEEHTYELQSHMRNAYAVFCLTQKK